MSKPQDKGNSPLLRAYLMIEELEAKVAALTRKKSEPIAIVGMSCRFPGGANNPEQFWQFLRAGKDMVSEIPRDRWDIDAYYDPDPQAHGKMYTRQGSFLDQVDQFDADFFNITPREAINLDPQQRILLEVAWEAFEDAGMAPHSLTGSATGVFVGMMNMDYLLLNVKDTDEINAYSGTGNTLSVAAGRLAYVLGLQGPAMTVDTACASSLVSVHLACQSLRNGEAELALAGGVNLMLAPDPYIMLSRINALAPDGRCKTFDASADGYARGEGCGLVVLKRLSDAQRDGDRIYAVIRGSAVNHVGPSSGLTVPNGQAQQALLRQALKSAGVSAEQISYVEAHGTGTSLGDPIELHALDAVLGQGRNPERPLVVGSVKTNIGHLEGAAGISGLMKLVLSLQHEEIPAHLHLKQLNPMIQLDETGIVIPTEARPWSRGDRPRIGGVSALALNGTNAHMIVEEAPLVPETESAAHGHPLHILSLSAKNEAALRELAQKFSAFCEEHQEQSFADICYTANTGRNPFPHRLAIIANSSVQARTRLQTFLEKRTGAGVIHNAVPHNRKPRIAFVCSGQGAQYRGMGRHLYEHSSIFRNALQRCNEVLGDALQPSLLQVLFGTAEEQALVDETRYTQPVLFAFEYALAQWWQQLGVEPDVVLGHSVGEYVAAVLAGLLSLEEALQLIATRGRLMAEQTEAGAMLAVFAEASRVQEVLDEQGGQVTIAVYNGPQDLVLSGSPAEIAEVQERLEQAGLRVRRLAVSHAFHSPLMEPMLEAFGEVAGQCHFGQMQLAWISSQDGHVLSEQEARQPQYWQRQVREPVRFDRAVETLQAQGVDLILEIGPQATLSGLLAKQMGEQSWTVQASQRPSKGEWESLLEAVGQLYVHGVPLNWTALHEGEKPRKVALPTYPFQRQRYLIEQRKVVAVQTEPFANWFYQLTWQAQDHKQSSTEAHQETGWWLLFADQKGYASDFARYAVQRGEQCVLVSVKGQQNVEEADYQFDPDNAEAFEPVLHKIVADANTPCRGMLYFWALDSLFYDEAVALLEQQKHLCSPVLALLKVLVKEDIAGSPRLWMITQQAIATADEMITHVQQASIWGIGRTIALEHPEIWGGLIDLPDTDIDVDMHSVYLDICDTRIEREIAYRHGKRLVARLVASDTHSSQVPATPAITGEGTYLISGGSGSIGLHIAHWLVEQGARHLCLLTRRGANEEAQTVIKQLEAQGAHILVARADVAHCTDLEHVFTTIQESGFPLKGVIHLAGVLEDGILLQQHWERFARVMAPKVAGAWNLHLLTRTLDLDFFVLFSSAAALLGSAGQSNYAAANAFMDALAHWRTGQGLPAMSLNWGPWSETGMAAHLKQNAANRAVQFISPQKGEQLFGYALRLNRPQLGIMQVKWGQLVHEMFAGSPVATLSQLIVDSRQNLETPQPPSALETQSEVVKILQQLPLEMRRERLLQHIKEQVVGVLGFEADYPLDIERGLFDMGMDSLMAVELKNRLQRLLSCKLPPTLSFDYPNVVSLTDYLLALLSGTDTEQDLPHEANKNYQEPIAITGMGCRFPGGVDSPEAFWELLQQENDAICDVPANRWNIDAYYDPDMDALGKMYTRRGGFLTDIDQFDADFFGVAPREANSMDPQQRLLLETTWEALERAGIAPRQIAGSRTGVFVGIGNNDYIQLKLNGDELAHLSAYDSTGNTLSIAAGRLAYVLGVHGPTMSIDTACSSALVAVHLACQSLRNGESDLAIAGGVNVLAAPESTILLSRTRALSPDGACKTFDASANGYVRGEGCGIIVLKRLSEAQRDGDPILGLIRGSAINHDGASSGLTVPSGPAQQAVLRAALQQAEVEAAQVQYVEAHGTGTPLGDPIEAQALGAVFGGQRPAEQPLWMGSVKSSIGHLEPAAGIAGLIKVVLCLQQEAIPPQQHFHQLNPLIDAHALQVAVVRKRMVWPRGEQVRVGGVSAFGLSGTNAHVLLQEAPLREPYVQADSRPQVGVLTLSAKTAEALEQVVERYERWLGTTTEEWAAICATSQMGRSSFAHRVAMVASGTEQARERLRQVQQGRHLFGVVQHTRTPGTGPRPRIAFVCSGQGAQYRGMGRHLYEHSSVFRNALQRCDKVLGDALQPSLLQVLFGTPEEQALVDETRYTQPVLFAFEYALAQWWQQLGVEPDVVLGHSVGEYVAAVLAGLLSLEEALGLITMRGRLMAEQTEAGAMLAVFAEASRVQEVLDEQGGQVTIAVYNGPQDLVLSGSPAGIAEVQERLEQAGLRVRQLAVSHAFHSPLMEPMLEAFGEAAEQCHFGSVNIPWISSHHGALLSEQEARQPQYWQRQVREPVRFDRAVETLQGQGVDLVLEIGPQATLSGLLAKQMGAQSWTVQASQRPSKGEWESLLEAVGQLYVHGVSLNWTGLYEGEVPGKVVLPTYPFQRQRYWVDVPVPGTNPARSMVSVDGSVHPVMGKRLRSPGIKDIIFEQKLGPTLQPFLHDHRLYENIVVPGAYYLSVLLSISQSLSQHEQSVLEDVHFTKALTLEEQQEKTLQAVFVPDETNNGAYTFQFFSLDEQREEWMLHASGHLHSSASPVALHIAMAEREVIQARCPDVLDGADFYRIMQENQLHLGLRFQWIMRVWRGQGEALCQLGQAVSRTEPYLLYPSLIDACVQLLGASLFNEETIRESDLVVPVTLKRFSFYQRPSAPLWAYVQILDDGVQSRRLQANIQLSDEDGHVVALFEQLTLAYVSRSVLTAGSHEDVCNWLYPVIWRPDVPEMPMDAAVWNGSSASGGKDGYWLIIADEQGHGQMLACLFQARNERCILVLGQGSAQPDTDCYVINVQSRLDFGQLFAGLRTAEPHVCHGIFYLRGLDDYADGDPLQQQRHYYAGALALVQGLIDARWAEMPRLWLVTVNAQIVTGNEEATTIAAATLWGMGRVIDVEYPELRCTCVDLDRHDLPAGLAALLEQNSQDDRERSIALRNGQRYVQRVVEYAPEQHLAATSLLSAERLARGSYLITGGTGALGLEVAGWLVERGARHLVLQSRSMPDAQVIERIQQLEQQGAHILTVQADVAHKESMAKLFSRIQQELPPLQGIVHAAGIIADGMLQSLSEEQFQAVMRPKVAGAWNLHELSAGYPLDFFVLFSSTAALFGSAGQGNYAAANAFMDALAQMRHRQGLVALSINWGPWAEVGMAHAVQVSANRRDSGIGLIPVEQGLASLAELIDTQQVQVGVVPIEWKTLVSRTEPGEEQPLLFDILHKLRQSNQALIDTETVAPSSVVIQKLLEMPAERRYYGLLQYLQESVAYVLGFDTAQIFDPLQGFTDLGLDSLMKVDLKNRLQRELKHPFPSTLAFDYPTIDALARYIQREVLNPQSGPTEHQTDASSDTTALEEALHVAIVSEVQQLSEKNLEEVVLEELRLFLEEDLYHHDS